MYNLGWCCFGKTYSRLGRFVGCELYKNYSLGTLFDTHVLVHADALWYSMSYAQCANVDGNDDTAASSHHSRHIVRDHMQKVMHYAE